MRGDLNDNLWSLVKEGVTPQPSLYDRNILLEAVDYVRSYREPKERQPGEDDGEGGELAAVGSGFDDRDEAVPFAKPGKPVRYSRYFRWRDRQAAVDRYRGMMRACYAAGAAGAWDESKHPRGQPKNAGEFAPKGGGGRIGGMSEKRPQKRSEEKKQTLPRPTKNTTDNRRNRELGDALHGALTNAGIECGYPDGWDESLYADVIDESGDWSGKLRISDHEQPAGGGYSERLGGRHGEADISVIAQSGVGGDLDFGIDGKIIRVGRVRVTYDDDVPDRVRAALDPIIADFAKLYDRRAESSKKAAETRKVNLQTKQNEKLRAWWAKVRAELARNGVVDVDSGDNFPRPYVATGEPDRNKRLSHAGNQIDIVTRRLFAEERAEREKRIEKTK